MIRDEVATLNALMVATLILMLIGHSLPVIDIHLDGSIWSAIATAEACFDSDLNVAMGDALDAMVTWMQSLFGLDKAPALALASTTVDLRITQVANQVWGVHAVLPAGVAR